jgi:hypothetical protein
MKQIFVPFGDYLPDLPALGNPGSKTINNCLPWSDGVYIPLRATLPVSDALTATCRGAYSSRQTDSTAFTFAGDATKLYEFTGAAGTATDRSGATYTLTTPENWEFAKWGNKIIATNFDDVPQIITIGAATNFAALGGSPPKARHIALVKDFVVLANLNEGGTLEPDKVRWSGVNNEATWTASASTQSDAESLKSSAKYGGGWIMGVRGGEYGVIFQEFSIWRMSYIGSPAIFQFDEVLPGYGTPSRNSIAQYGNLIFYLGQEGFDLLVNGTERVPIGYQKIDSTFLAEVDPSYMHKVIGAIDPQKRIVSWIYPGPGSSSGTPNRMISYNWLTKKWAPADIDAEWIYPGMGQGYTLEELDEFGSLDDLGDSLDSRRWAEGSLQMTIFDTAHKQASFSGDTLAATLTTSEKQFAEGRRAIVTGATPIIDGSAAMATVTPITRNLQTVAQSVGAATSVHTETGVAPLRADARYHSFRVTTSGDYNYALGVNVHASASGSR